MRVSVFGPIFGHFGYGTHSRGVALGLVDNGVDVQVRPSMRPDGCRCSECRRVGAMWDGGLQYTLCDRHVAVIPAAAWHYEDGPSALFTTVESKRAHAHIVRCGKAWDRVIVPSRYSYDAMVGGGMPRGKLAIVPEGFSVMGAAEGASAEIQDYQVKRYFPQKGSGTGIRCLYFGDYSTRKGMRELGFAFGIACRERDDLFLTLCANQGGERSPEAQTRLLSEVKYFAKLGCNGAERRIKVTVEYVSERRRAEMYRSAHVYVHLGRGEAWNLTVGEAYGEGLEVVALAEGGHRDFLTGYDWYPVMTERDGELPVGKVRYVFDHVGVPFATVDVVDAGMQICKAAESARRAGRRTPRRRPAFYRAWSWKRAGAKLVRVLEGMRGRSKEEWSRTVWPRW